MRRIDALSVALCALLLVQTVISQEADPCKRQPFRGRCPGTGPNGQPQRSQFVLRYYLRSGECVSYPYGHCSNDENEPKLFRYKEECEDACIGDKEVVEHTQSPNSVQTYATMSPGKSECQKQRELKGSGNLVKGAYVPECEADGSFKALQCEQDGLTCFCVDRSGIELTNSRCQPGQPKPDCEKIAAAPPMRSNECTGGVNAGPCQGHIPRWFYDERTLQCKQFDYSGCGGNGNNYATEVACKLRCAPQPEAKDQFCHSGLPLKNPEGSLADCSKSSCPSGFKCNNLPTQSVCCPDVEKNAEAGVLDSGRKANPCSLPKERGPCDKYELRFYYSAELKECKYFFYGGCDGNANNFGRKEECDQVCNAGQAVNAGETPTAAPATEVQEQTTAQETVVPAVTTEVIPENEPEPIQTTVDTFEPSTTTVVERTTVDQTLVKLNSKEEEATEERPEDRQTTVAEIEAPSEQKATTEEQKTETEAPANEATTQQAVQVDSEAQAEEKSEQKETSKPIDNGTEDSELTQRPVQETEVPTQPQTQPPETVAPVQTRPPRPQTKRPPPPTTTAVPLPTNRCQHPVDSGNCGGRFDRWIWNAEKRICESFIYTGCGGNGNNFGSREECLSICHIEVVPKVSPKEVDLENVCDAEIDAGNCGGSFLRFAFDKETKDCKQFNYGGCGGNGNNFANMKDCRKKCADNVQATTLPEDLCEHPVDVGECSGVFARFAYNQLTNDCQQFTYGGCGGNGNNFPNKAECLSACAKVKCPPEPACDIGRCQLVKDAHGCSFCSCPPPPSISHPPLQPPPVINQRPHCPVLDLQSCTDPCIIFTNREGCQECVCPVTPPTFVPRPPGSFEGRPPAPPAPPAPVDIPHKQPKPPTVEGRPLKQNTENEIRDEVRPEVFPEREFPIQPAPPPRQHAIAPPDFSEPFPELGEQCTQRMDPGPCSNFVQRWFFNPAQGACEPFQYGGCAGNRNHFFTERECQIHCQRFAAHVPTTSRATSPVPPPTTSRPAQQGLPNFRENPLPADKVIQPPTTEAPEVPEEKTTYPAEPMTTPNPALASQSTIGRIVTGGLNYQTGKQHGVKNNPSANIDESQLDLVSGKPIETLEEAAQHFDNVAACPNHKEPLRYADGNTVLCLPGRNQCPDNSVCYFNGLDFFCCPNVDDPYDNHIFGGYDGEEEKHGYKNTLNIKAIPSRARRHAAQRPLPASSFSIDHITSPLRFDGQAPKQISRAGLAGLRVNPCTQEVQKGSCEGQHLRYFYDIHSDDCRLFYFSGCDGNDNNFATQVECERRCKLGPIIEKPAPIANDKTPAGQCPNGQAPLGENAPVLCGNQTDSIGCPSGYYCREGPPDVCCPTEGNEILTPQRQWGDVRRKERVQFSASVSEKAPLPVHQAAFGVATKTQDKDLDQKIPLIEAKNEPEDISQAKQPELFPSNMCPDGSDALNGSEGKPLVCGAGLSLDGFKMCPRGFYCSMDLERNSRLCCPLEIQSSNVPPPPVVAPYLGHRHANPGEAIGRGSLPSDLRRRA